MKISNNLMFVYRSAVLDADARQRDTNAKNLADYLRCFVVVLDPSLVQPPPAAT